MYLNIKEDQK